MSEHPTISQAIRKQFPYTPTGDQQILIEKLAAFIKNPEVASLFLLKGYAGTGKTTMVSSLVNVLPALGAKSVLLAPTGRAAKVFSSYSGHPAFTIHKKIYRMLTGTDGSMNVVIQENKHKDTFFIVDEASMISGGVEPGQESLFGVTHLLDDLIQYVSRGINCRLILMGDTAQLPPVRTPESPALSEAYLNRRYHLHIDSFEIKEVVRQALDSGILHNATLLRQMLAGGQTGFPAFELAGFRDFRRLDGPEAADEVNSAYMSGSPEGSLIICRSNKRANMYNQFIRQRVLFMEDEISAGDLLLVAKNNYFWLPEDSNAGFIANGDILEIRRIHQIEEMHGFRFAHLNVKLMDYPDEPDLDTWIILDTLDAAGPALSTEQQKQLYEAVAADYADIPNKRTRMEQIRKDRYFNALQVKFAYALTCHKSQGGQWENVFVEMGYLRENHPDTEYLRWLYTAITRATHQVFLMGFTDDFFKNT
ncbi:MAG: AAA family ATPase [Bacteroidales bacterium]